MKNGEKEPWQIAAARYFVQNSEKGVTTEEYRTFIKTSYSVSDSHLNQFILDEIRIPSGKDFQTQRNPGPEERWTPPLEMVSMITDFDELQEARKNAYNAFIMSLIAIGISIIAVFVPFVTAYFMVQTIEVEQTQFDKIFHEVERLPKQESSLE